MDSATELLRALLSVTAVRASLADARPTWLIDPASSEVLFMNRAGARLLGNGSAARFSPVVGGPLALQVLNRSTASPLLALRFNSHLVTGALPVQITPVDLVDGRNGVLVVALKQLPKSDTDAYSLDDLLALLIETDLAFGLYDADSEPIEIEGPRQLLDSAFDAAFPNPLDTIDADQRPNNVEATVEAQRFTGTVYPLPGFDRMVFLVLGMIEDLPDTLPEVPDPAPATPPSIAISGDAPQRARAGRPERFVFETDRHGEITFASKNGAELFTELTDGPVGHFLEDLCDPSDLASQTKMASIFAGEETFSEIAVPVVVRGESATALFNGVPKYLRDGTFGGFRGFGLIDGIVAQTEQPQATVEKTAPQAVETPQEGEPAASAPVDQAGTAAGDGATGDAWEEAEWDDADWPSDEFFDRLDTAAGLDKAEPDQLPDDVPAGETPVDKVPVDEAPVDDVSVDEAAGADDPDAEDDAHHATGQDKTDTDFSREGFATETSEPQDTQALSGAHRRHAGAIARIAEAAQSDRRIGEQAEQSDDAATAAGNVVHLHQPVLPDPQPLPPGDAAAFDRIAQTIEEAFEDDEDGQETGDELAESDGTAADDHDDGDDKAVAAAVADDDFGPSDADDAAGEPETGDTAELAQDDAVRAADGANEPANDENEPADDVGPMPDNDREESIFDQVRREIAQPAAASAATIVHHPNAVTMAEQAALLERLPLSLVIFRGDHIAYANRSFFELLDYPDLDSLRDAGGLEAIFPILPVPPAAALNADLARHTLTAYDRKGRIIEVVARLQTIPYGGETCMLLTMRPAPGAPAPVGKRSAVHVDHAILGATMIDATEDAKAARIEELQTIIDTATDGIVVINADGSIDRLNSGAESLFGYTNAEISGKPFITLFTAGSQGDAKGYLADLAENGVASLLNDGREMTGCFKTGGAIPLFVTVGRISSESDSKFCAVMRDITHFKSAETELVRARKRAEDASAQKSEFLAKISHEIRTPLNSIIGFSEVMMSEQFGPLGNGRYREYARDVHSGGTHLLSLINDLLDLSKIEAGKLDLTFASVDLNTLVRQCVSIMQPDANRERLIVRTNLPSNTPPVVADPRSLRQIILNILSNSIKFTEPGGQIIATTRQNERGEVTLTVRDTGVGMSNKDLETALEPFRQIATTNGNETGTGLGLPLTKAMVEANRAIFEIESTPGDGTTIRITFPVTRVLAE